MFTKFGNAKINTKGYYQITSVKEGNYKKYLHRLIYEDFYGSIPDGWDVHHIDGNSLNNDISNLVAIEHGLHARFHKEGKTFSHNHKREISKIQNTSGYFRVGKQKNPNYKQGFTWVYRYYVNGKQKIINSVDLSKLKDKVLANGLPWEEI